MRGCRGGRFERMMTLIDKDGVKQCLMGFVLPTVDVGCCDCYVGVVGMMIMVTLDKGSEKDDAD